MNVQDAPAPRYTLTIDNFQSIQHLKLDFSKFTAVIGPTNRGKSAIIRALDALLHNNYHPVMLREGADQCTLSLTLHDHPVIRNVTLVKNPKKGINTYRITKADGSTEEHPKSGLTTPQTMHDAGILTLETDRGQSINTNFHGQHEPLFLLMSTETQVTDVFNALFQTDKIEAALLRVNKDNLSASREFTDNEAKINVAVQNLAKREAEAVAAQGRLDYLVSERDRFDSTSKDAASADTKRKAVGQMAAQAEAVSEAIDQAHRKLVDIERSGEALTVSTRSADYRDRRKQAEKQMADAKEALAVATSKAANCQESEERLRSFDQSARALLKHKQLREPIPPKDAAEKITLVETLTPILAIIGSVLDQRNRIGSAPVLPANIDKKITIVEDLIPALNVIFHARHHQSMMYSVSRSIALTQEQLADTLNRIEEIDEEKRQAEALIPRCPTCGRAYDSTHKEHIN